MCECDALHCTILITPIVQLLLKKKKTDTECSFNYLLNLNLQVLYSAIQSKSSGELFEVLFWNRIYLSTVKTGCFHIDYGWNEDPVQPEESTDSIRSQEAIKKNVPKFRY